jgi:hypothetical protein
MEHVTKQCVLLLFGNLLSAYQTEQLAWTHFKCCCNAHDTCIPFLANRSTNHSEYTARGVLTRVPLRGDSSSQPTLAEPPLATKVSAQPLNHVFDAVCFD